MTPDKRLEQLADLFKERARVYGDGYKEYGKLLSHFFPNGVNSKSVEDSNRFYILTMIITKLKRYCDNFNNGGHVDSLDDLAVYAMILQSYDEEVRVETSSNNRD